ncbi:carbohydrate ABC transporter permease [Paenibacillus sp. strain BS8-2]
MLQKRTVGEFIFENINAFLLILLSISTLYPLLFVLFASLSEADLLVQSRGILFWPQGFSLDAYKAVFQNPMVSSGYVNTLFYTLVGTFVNIFLTCLGAYGLSRKNVLLKNPIMLMIVFTMFFNGGLIPNFILINNLGMLDTRWSLIFPLAISAWNLIILRTSFQAVPASLEEAARVDGANDITILWRVIIPLSLPAIAVISLFYGVHHWNSWFSASIYLQDRDLFPLQLILREILIQNVTDGMTGGVDAGNKMQVGETIKYATIMVATLPILVLYPFLQKYFVKGVMIGAVKE